MDLLIYNQKKEYKKKLWKAWLGKETDNRYVDKNNNEVKKEDKE